MDLNDLPTYRPDINKLKVDLHSFCEANKITKFEADDIIELLTDGEKVAWIVDQLSHDNAAIDADILSKLLNDIKGVVAPAELEEEESEAVTASEPEVTTAEEEFITELPDLSQLDFSQLGDMLPPGMKLPPGMDLNLIKKIMESPQGKTMADFTVFCQEKGVDFMGGFMEDTLLQQQLQQEWMSTPRPAFDGKTPAELMQSNPTLMPPKVETYRREEPRIGRNDPCPCGSGKKYKKCCGRV